MPIKFLQLADAFLFKKVAKKVIFLPRKAGLKFVVKKSIICIIVNFLLV